MSDDDSSTTSTVALTSIFTPPASCSHAWTYEAESYNLLPYTLLLQNAVDVNTPCFPPGFRANGRAFALEVYSPGWCPRGYTSASLVAPRGTTTAVCCQSDFFYTTSTSPQADGNTLSFTGCISSYDSSTSVLSRSGSVATESESVGPGVLWGQPITVINEQSDLSLFSTSTSSQNTPVRTAAPSTTATPPVASSTAGFTSAAASPSSTAESSGLSTGASVGIGVGVALAVVFLLAIAGFFLWRRKRKGNRPAEPELDSRQVPPTVPPQPPAELDAERARHEMEGAYAPQKPAMSQPQSTSAYETARAKGWRPRTVGPMTELPT